MPKRVDHDVRREELAGAVWAVVMRHGLEGVTIRDVAKESGWSTGVVNHYFRDKDELMQYAFELSIERSVERLQRHSTGVPPHEAIRIIMVESLAVNEEQRLENLLWAAFVGKAITSPAMSEVLSDVYRDWCQRLVDLINQGQRDGSIRRDIDSGAWSRSAMALVDGLVIQSFFLSGGERQLNEQLRLVDQQVDSLREPQSDSGRQSARAGMQRSSSA
jgi:AcrR family transcriptional regulator